MPKPDSLDKADSLDKPDSLDKAHAALISQQDKAAKRLALLAIESGLADSNFTDAEIKRGFVDMVARFQS